MVGELERLGKNGEDYLVSGVDVPSFKKLTPRQKIFTYYLYRAAVAGNDITYMQNHRHALEIKTFLEQIYLNSGGMDKELKHAVLDYLKYIWINHGQYYALGLNKFVPNYLTKEMLLEAAKYAEKKGAKFNLEKEENLESKINRLEKSIFDINFEPVVNDESKDVDNVKTSAVNFYHSDLTEQHINDLSEFWRTKLNVRFDLMDGKVVPQVYKIGGLYGKDIETISFFLKKALQYAENKGQKMVIKTLIDYYRTGDEGLYREHTIHWLKSQSNVDFVNGFVEQYHDPRSTIGTFEGNVYLKSDSAIVEKLAENALYFERKMPWDDKYKKEKVEKPVAVVADVLIGTGDCGPSTFIGFNLPNYADIRRDHGSKNVIALNIINSGSGKCGDAAKREFYLPKYYRLMKKYEKFVVTWETYLHEIIGHGSGKPDPNMKGTPALHLGPIYSSLEEGRADAVALYHIFDPKLVEIGGFSEGERDDVIKAMYLYYYVRIFKKMTRFKGDTIRSAHRRGEYLITQYLLNGGKKDDFGKEKKDFGVKLVKKAGDYYFDVVDVGKARAGVAEILTILQQYKSTGDKESATKLFETFGTYYDKDLYKNSLERSNKIKCPKKKVFVFPWLAPVVKNGEIMDVEIKYDKDLTAQQLEFSKMRFSKEI